jgi:TonB family protein
VFEYACGAVPKIAYQRSPQSLLLSVLLHATVVLALFAVHFSPGAPNVSRGRQHVILIAPPLSPPPAIVRARLRPPDRAVPRSFRAPPALPAPVPANIALDRPPPPVLETPRPLLAAPELARIPVAPPPPLKTNNLIAALPEVLTPTPKLSIQSAGFSSAESPAPNLQRGALSATAAFSNATAEPERPHPSVSKGGFSDASVAAAGPVPRAAPVRAPAVVTPVEILFKPHPLYAPEARRLKIEGEVLVELLFAVSGEARVMRVVRGLGHGLDENAISAAQSIRFRPAQRGGAPVDSTAIVHIIFQLAY